MSTRSRIAMKTESGYRSIYCHNFGEPEIVGAMLLTCYTDKEKIKDMISLGNMSALGPEIGEKHEFKAFGGNSDKHCTFYIRDRDEDPDDNKPEDSPNLEHLFQITDQCNGEWLYLWDGEKWQFSPIVYRGPDRTKLGPLTKEAIREVQ